MTRKDLAEQLGIYAATVIRERFRGAFYGEPVYPERSRRKPISVREKPDASVVTDVDEKIEAHSVAEIGRAFPDDTVIGEEGNGHAGTSGFAWYIDPIDGTTNFSLGLPIFATSVGVAKNDVPVIGVIGLPLSSQLMVGESDREAWQGQRRLRVSRAATVRDGLVLLAFRGAVEGSTEGVDGAAVVIKKVRKIRVPGSAVWGFAMIVQGSAVGGVFLGMHSWDVAAGILLVQEAGGRVTDLKGDAPQLTADSISLVVSNGLVHNELLELSELNSNIGVELRKKT